MDNPETGGLYDPADERSSCGVGFLTRKGRDVLELLEDHPPRRIDEFLPLLRPLPHRS